jgi:signal peptidase II
VLGGAIGNFIDRVSKGKVVDFLDFYFGNYNFPTFNIADTFIVLGTIILAVYILFFNKKEDTKIWGF